MKHLLTLIVAALVGGPALADNHNTAEEREAAERARELAAVEMRAELAERREEIARRQAEMQALAAELAGNSVELVELQKSLEPDIAARVRRSLVIADRPLLGISIGPAAATEPDGVAGVRIVGVTPGGPADSAGILTGDVIVAIAETPLASADARGAERLLLDELSALDSDVPVTLTVSRDDTLKSIDVTPVPAIRHSMQVFEMPDVALAVEAAVDPMTFAFQFDTLLSDAQRAWDGLELVELTPGLARYFATEAGLLVLRVPTETGLDLEDGDVIVAIDGREPKTVQHAMRILRSYEAGESLRLDLMRDRRKLDLEVTVPEVDLPTNR